MSYFDECVHLLYEDENQIENIKNRHSFKQKCPAFIWKLDKFLKIFNPHRFDVCPNIIALNLFEKWIELEFKTDSKKKCLIKTLKKLNRDQKYEELVTSKFKVQNCFQNEYSEILKLSGKKKIKYKVFLNHVEELTQISLPNAIGDIDLFVALKFCSSRQNLTDVRIFLLQVFNFKGDISILKFNLKRRQEFLPKRFEQLIHDENWNHRTVHYPNLITLCDALQIVDTTELCNLTKEQMLERLETIHHQTASIFKLLKKELELQGSFNDDLILFLEFNLPFSFTGQTKLMKLRQLSEWHNLTIDTILKNLNETSKTSFRKQSNQIAETQTATILHFLLNYYKNKFDASENILKTFFEKYDTLDIDELTREFVTTRKIENEKVKSSLNTHSAESPVSDLHHFLKCGLSSFIHYKYFNQADFIHNLTNHRVAANPQKNRTFTDEEIDRMYLLAQNQPDTLLILIFLREIGLRISAIMNLTVGMIYDINTHCALHICNVPEKGCTYRQFITSDFLKNHIQKYICTQSFKSSEDNLFQITRSTLSQRLKKLACDAHVSTTMHPHAFRHTIVGKLIENGNSLEVVSKFMGHASIKTTERHYFVSTVQQLHEQMNNPFTKTFHKRKLEKEEEKVDLDLLQMKKQKLSELIHIYNKIIATNCKEQKSAEDIKKQIFQTYPQLGSMLSDLMDS